jgi:hypothetical protein
MDFRGEFSRSSRRHVSALFVVERGRKTIQLLSALETLFELTRFVVFSGATCGGFACSLILIVSDLITAINY